MTTLRLDPATARGTLDEEIEALKKAIDLQERAIVALRALLDSKERERYRREHEEDIADWSDFSWDSDGHAHTPRHLRSW